MLPAWIEPLAGNHGMISASGIAIAVSDHADHDHLQDADGYARWS